jgi:hypothetical protein
MNITRLSLLIVLNFIAFQPVFSQNKKFDKSLKKVDAYYASGSFSKASTSLLKLKKSIIAKMGQQNTYMPGLYIREAHINLASGVLDGLERIARITQPR